MQVPKIKFKRGKIFTLRHTKKKPGGKWKERLVNRKAKEIQVLQNTSIKQNLNKIKRSPRNDVPSWEINSIIKYI